MRRLAVIDIGTNSILYLLAEKAEDGRIRGVFQKTESTRLGGALEGSDRIAETPLERAITVLNGYCRLAEAQHAEKIVAVGTHLFRQAVNRREVIQSIQARTALEVIVLSESEEARWGHCGALYGRAFSEPVLTADIGGGSTEVVFGRDGQIAESASRPLGAVLLSDRFFRHDPPDPAESANMESYIASEVANHFGLILKKGKRLIAVGGTVTTLAALKLGLETYDPEKVDGTVLTPADVQRNLSELAGLDPAEREKRLALDPKRADIIVAGTMILKWILKCGHFNEALVSDQGLRFGIALREFETNRESI